MIEVILLLNGFFLQLSSIEGWIVPSFETDFNEARYLVWESFTEITDGLGGRTVFTVL